MLETKTETVRARLAPEVKEAAEAIFNTLGLSHSDAIRLFYQQVILTKGLPFKVKISNKETTGTLQQVQAGKKLKHYKNTKQLFDKFR
jgi:DNA-damage-inducible protein J